MNKPKYIKEAIVWNCYVGKNGAWVRISDLNYVEEEDKYYPTFTGTTKMIISEAYPYKDWMEEYIGTDKPLTKDKRFNMFQGVKCGSIDNCCKGKKLYAGGFQWKYSTSTNNIEPIRASRRKICVAQYDKDGNFITAYSSCREAAKTNNLTFQIISDCINNKRKTLYGGFVWKKLIENS